MTNYMHFALAGLLGGLSTFIILATPPGFQGVAIGGCIGVTYVIRGCLRD